MPTELTIRISCSLCDFKWHFKVCNSSFKSNVIEPILCQLSELSETWSHYWMKFWPVFDSLIRSVGESLIVNDNNKGGMFEFEYIFCSQYSPVLLVCTKVWGTLIQINPKININWWQLTYHRNALEMEVVWREIKFFDK